MVDPLTTDQWAVQLLTLVTMATVLLEAPPGLVGVMECGLQCVSVSGMDFVLFVFLVYRSPMLTALTYPH